VFGGSRSIEAHPLALSLPTRSGLGGSELLRLAQAAEDAGLDAVFVAERVADALALCQQIASGTRSIAVGTAVMNARLRHPVLTAMSAMALAEASRGRFVLGLGMSNAQLNEVKLGLEPVAPRSWMAEYLAVVRQALGGGPVRYAGRYFAIDNLELDRVGTTPVPVYLGALQPQMLRLAATMADGVILNLTSLETMPTLVQQAGSAVTDRDPVFPTLDVLCVVQCCVSDDAMLARRAARHAILDYVLHPAAAQIFRFAAEPGLVERLQDAVRSGDRDRAVGLVPLDLVDALVVSGTPAECAQRINAYRAVGASMPVIFPRPLGPDWPEPVWKMAAAYRALEPPPARLDGTGANIEVSK
jgi:alkanesulfonate monooxygenase SsuD/methylene tetrahydromethanopterin reductase-like flavin-dependent oxidoreductase (luciferase family)